MSQIFDVVLSNLSRHGIENCLEIANEIEVEMSSPISTRQRYSFEEVVEVVFNATTKHFPTYIEYTVFNGVKYTNVIPITMDALKTKSRKRELVEVRQIMMHILTAKLDAATLKSIGGIFGNRDHSTVIHARDTIDGLLDVGKDFKRSYDAIYNEVKGQLSYEN